MEAERTAVEQRRFHPRTENPILASLTPDSVGLERFLSTTQQVINKFEGQPISDIYSESVPYANVRGEDIGMTVAEIPYNGCSDAQLASFKNLLLSMDRRGENRSHALRITEGLFFKLDINRGGGIFGVKHIPQKTIKPQLTHYLRAVVSRDTKVHGNPHDMEGLFMVGEQELPVVGTAKVQAEILVSKKPQSGKVELHSVGRLTEIEFAYQTVITSLIVAGKIDMSTERAVTDSLPQRQQIFLEIYHQMLSEMIPPVKVEDLYGLEGQLEDIDLHLYQPLIRGGGNPMNTLMVGAPGVGKSLTARFLVSKDQKVLTVPLPISAIDNSEVFESQILPKLLRLKINLGIPVVVSVDDIEAILEQNVSRAVGGEGVVDSKKRSEALNLLERLMDTYNIYILGSLNHPDVEAAFLRRFNPVYYPLPTREQRLNMLTGTLPIDTLGDSDQSRHQAVSQLIHGTEGFNYSGLALIREYLNNILHSAKGITMPEALQVAIGKARQRTPIIKLGQFDQAAKVLVNEKKGRIGFNQDE